MAVIHWVGGSSTHFNDPANWNPAQVPGVADDAIINPAAAVSIDSPTNITINSLSLVATATLTVNASTTFTVNAGTNGAGIAGQIAVANSGVLSIGGTIVNTGTISETSGGTTTTIVLNQTTNTLTGGGKVVLSANTNNHIIGAAANFELDNVDNTISGAGNIGNGQMVLSNEGVINANQAAAALTINTAGNVIINSGTMEATLGGDLNVLSAVNNVGGTIEAVGAGSIVFLQANVTGGSVLATGGGVVQTSGTSGVLDGLGLHPVTNGSAIQVTNGQVLTLLGTIINNGAINLNASVNNTDLRIGSPIVTLQGTGAVHLTNNANNRIFGNSGAFQLINKTNTIDGAGQLGAGQLTFTNNGLVNATQSTSLVLNTNGQPVTNTGTLQASNTGGLFIQNTAINNTGGLVRALVAGSHVDLSGSAIEGGTLTSANGGVIQTVSGNGTLDGITFGTLTNNGTVQVNDQTILSLVGTINNIGTILENQQSASGSTQIRIANQTVTLQGAGKLTMSNNGLNQIFGNASNNQLINVDNTISGAGQLGAGQLTLINQAKGVINANQAASISVSGQLLINTSNSILVNAGLLESTNTGGLLIQNTTVNNAGGFIKAQGAGSLVSLSGSTIQGGTLITIAGGMIQTVTGSAGFDGITSGLLNNTGIVQVTSQTQLDLAGTINNAGTILENQQGNSGSTRIRLTSQQVTLVGAGTLLTSSNSLNQIFGTGSNTLNNFSTIAGAGQLGTGATMFLVNFARGNINANQAVALTLNTGSNLVTNIGTLQDTGAGGLVIQNTAVSNAGGTVKAVGAGTHVDLQSADIMGGLLTTSGGGVIQTVDNGSVLDGVTAGFLTNQGSILVNDNTGLTLVGKINNTGTISLASVGSSTRLRIGSPVVTLQGGGKLLMSDNLGNQIVGNNSSFQLVNLNNTIAGAGQIGTGATMFLINQAAGVINASQKAALVINTGSEIVTNAGTLESTGTVALNGGLVIQNTAVNNAGGTILAAGPLGHVDLDGGYIEGGLLTSTGVGLIQTVGGGATLNGLTSGVLTNKGMLLVNDHTTLTLVGTINNTGTIKQNATSGTGATTIRIGGQTATLTGNGQFLMTDNATNQVFGNSATFQLINQGNTISGAGQFGAGGMEFVNASGTIQGTGGNALVINLGSGNGVNNAGASINANGAGGVLLTSGIFTNNGLVTANDGSFLTYQSGAINTNLAEGDLVGGTWRAVAAGHGATLTLSSNAASGGPVINDAALVVLSGSGSFIQSFDPISATLKPLEQTMTNVAAGGLLQLLGNRGYSTTLNLNDSGRIALFGGTLQANALSVGTGGLLFGFGTVKDAPFNSGRIEAFAGALKVTGNVTGAGALQIDNASTLELGGTAAETATFAAGAVGTLKFDVSTSFTGSIAGLALGDVIDLGDISAATVTKATFKGGPLVVSYTGHPDLTYTVSGPGIDPSKNHFSIGADGLGGTALKLVAGADPGFAAIKSGIVKGSSIIDPSWVGGSGTSFNTAANWNPATVPVAGTAAVIGAGFSVVSALDNTMATFDLGAGSTLSITGGTFSITAGTGVSGIAATGTINVGNGDVLALGGTIVNAGTINDNSGGINTDIRFTQTTNVLTGGGKVVLSNAATNRIFATNASFVLDNVDNNISGAGQLGSSQLTLINEQLGVINANQSATPLTVDTGGNTIINAGIMEATVGGDLNILSSVNNTGGTITAIGAGSIVFLGATVSGGTVSASGGGIVQTSGVSGVLDGLGLHPVTNGSAIQVANGQNLTLLGTIINNSSINLNSTGSNTDLRIGSPFVTLKGTGAINLTNNPNNRIFGNSGAFQLNNLTNKIAGAGQLGAAQLTFSNAGVVDANQTTALILNTGANLVTNTGTMQATGTGGLDIQNTSVNNSGGTIQAVVAGAHVDLDSSAIEGGTLKGLIQTAGGNAVLDGITAGVLNNTGTVRVNDLNILSLVGTINNTGTIFENHVSTNGSAQIRIASQSVTLQGGGHLVMSNSGGNAILGTSASNTLINVNNVISGAGQLGSGQMTLVNQGLGVINADQDPSFFQSGQLVVNTGANVLVNAGTMEATAGGGLLIQNTVVSNTGLIKAVGATAHVDLSGAVIQGGTFAASGGAVIQTVASSTLDGGTSEAVTNTGQFLINDQTQLDLAGIINNTGTIIEDQESVAGSTRLRLTGSAVTLQGAGDVVMSNNINNLIFGTGSTKLINVDNTISGAGQIGTGATMFLVNQAAGVVDANQSTALVVNTGSRLLTNTGTLEATGTGGLVIQSTAINNAGGTIRAAGAGAHVDLQSAYLEGGVLTTSAGGVIQAVDRGNTLDGITAGAIANTGTIQVNVGQMLSLVGTINNTGTIIEAGFGNTGNTDLRVVGSTATLQGGGKVLMSNSANNRIFGNNANFQLINVNNTISGAGQIGTGATMFLVNQAAGVINANQKNALVVNLGGNLISNAGTLESTGTAALNGGLVLQNTSINNAGGRILAAGAAAHVDLSGAYLEGGTLATSGGGVIQTAVNTTSTLDGITAGTLNNSGTIRVNDTSTLNLVGTINNTGTILQSAFSANSNTDVRVVGPTATLTGTGQWIMSDNPNNRVFGNNATFQLINQGNTISGAGQFGTGGMSFINAVGSIIATGNNALVINLGTGAGVNNAGASMTATGAGGMVLTSGIFTNNGSLTANDGSSITYQSGTANTNLAEGDLVGGVWRANAAGHGAIVSMTGGPIVTDAANIVLQGAGSVIQAGSGSGPTPYTPLEQSLTTIASGGFLQVLANRGYASGQALNVSGTVILSGGTFQTNTLTTKAGGLLFGFGVVNDAVANAGKLEARFAPLTVTGNVVGTGALQADAGATLTLNGSTNSAATVLNNGTVAIGASDNLDVTGSIDPTSTGVFLLNNASVLEVAVDKGTSNKMNFIGNGKLTVDTVAQFGNNVGLATYTGPQLMNFGVGDQVQLADFNLLGAAVDSYSSLTGLLQLHSGATKATLLFQNSSLGGGIFHLGPDGGGHVLVTHS